MADPNEKQQQYLQTVEIIEELLADGSDPHCIYLIEHHLCCADFERLEKAALAVFKLGYEVTDAEEMEDEQGELIFCCDAISEMELDADAINQQVAQLMQLAEQHGVIYDGWGTYFEDPNEVDSEDAIGERFDSDDDGRRH